MKKRKIIIFVFVIAVFIVSTIVIVINKNEESRNSSKKFVIGMSQANLYEPWRLHMNNEISDEADKYDNIKIIFKDAGGDAEKQKSDIDDLINFGVDLLIVSINDSKELTPAVKEAYNHVPVIVLDRAVEGYDYTLYIGSDTESIGEKAGELVAEIADGRNINVVEIQGALNSSPDEQITKGFKSIINKYRNISIDRTIIANWQKNESQDKVQSLLNDDKNIDVIFAHSDYMALGAYYALKENGNQDDIRIIGVDGLEGREGGINLVRKGVLEGTFKCETGGKEAVQYAIKILNKEEDIPKKILLECDEITSDTLKK